MEPERKLTAAAVAAFQEGVGLVLSRWSALQLAVENEWGGRESRLKAEQLVSYIVSWVNFSTEPLYIDDLEEMLIEAMSFLNTVIEDGSIEEVVNDEEDSDEDDDDTDPSMNKDDSSNMIVDKPESHAVEPKTKQAVEAEDGWEVVGPRRSRGKRN